LSNDYSPSFTAHCTIDGDIMKAYFNSKKSFAKFHNEMGKEDYMDDKDIKK
jgi:hypothetical protein